MLLKSMRDHCIYLSFFLTAQLYGVSNDTKPIIMKLGYSIIQVWYWTSCTLLNWGKYIELQDTYRHGEYVTIGTQVLGIHADHHTYPRGLFNFTLTLRNVYSSNDICSPGL